MLSKHGCEQLDYSSTIEIQHTNVEGTILFIALLFKLLNCCSSSYVSLAENLIYSHCSRCLLSTPLKLVVLFFPP